mmetsp:Transcript_75723/g.126106  ORF Transcript_75723/g.126106 Transcript_75723/m.126106 type:complete len:85 (-) Transcript_75723:1929-2183(-)
MPNASTSSLRQENAAVRMIHWGGCSSIYIEAMHHHHTECVWRRTREARRGDAAFIILCLITPAPKSSPVGVWPPTIHCSESLLR